MSYATQQDLIDRFGQPELIQLTDREETATGVIDETKVTDALSAADAEINSYLARQMQTPIDPVPAQVREVAITIARFKLYVDNVPKSVQDAYDRAVAWLKLAAQGLVSLGNASGPTAPATAGDILIDSGCRTFDRDSMRDF